MIAVKKRVENKPDLEENQTRDHFSNGLFTPDESENIKDTNSIEPANRVLNEEIELDPKQYILSKTDKKGIIEYGNDYFVEISGYKESELIGQPHNIVRHPDMPKIVFKLLWQRIRNRKNILAIVKNLTKDGRYYWVMTEFEIKIDEITNEITGYFAYRKAAPREAIVKIAPLYKKLCEIEEVSGVEGSQKYLTALLEAENKTYDQFIEGIAGKNPGLMKQCVGIMGKFFSY